MALTKAQLESLVEAIRKRFISFRYDALGDRALTRSEIETLQNAGLLRRGVEHMVSDPITLGKIVALLPPSRRRMTYSELLDLVERMEIPTTEVERRAMEFAEAHAGEYIKGIEDMAVRTASTAAARAGMTAIRAVQDGVKEAIANRQSISELKTELFDMLDDRYRDWQRVAHTEINTAIQQGIFKEIRDKSDDGEDQLVYKRPSPDACKHCKRLYLTSDGITPKIFRLRELAESNVGMKAADWQPTIGSVHPWCHCQLHVVPEGYDFEKRRVAREGFEHGTEKIKAGQILDDSVYSRLSSENKERVKEDAVLTYTGETPRPESER